MKTLIISPKTWVTILLSLASFYMLAQDVYLPATSKSKEAKKLYQQSIEALLNADIVKGQKLAKMSLEKDTDLLWVILTNFQFKL